MTTSIKELKKNREAAIAAINAKLDTQAAPPEDTDNEVKETEYWYPEVDKAGNGFAIIRLMPAAPGDNPETVYAEIYEHGFKGPSGKWYIENSRTTCRPAYPIRQGFRKGGDKDPVAEANSKLWKAGPEGQAVVKGDPSVKGSKRSRKHYYHMNAYIIKDAQNPDREGKVFKVKFGEKLFAKIDSKRKPAYEGAKGVPVFDPWEGANFIIKTKSVAGYRNYDDSEWDSPGPLFNDDAKIEEVWNQCYSLDALLDESNFKSYAELQAHYNTVMSEDGGSDEVAASNEAVESVVAAVTEKPKATPARKPKATEAGDNYFESLARD